MGGKLHSRKFQCRHVYYLMPACMSQRSAVRSWVKSLDSPLSEALSGSMHCIIIMQHRRNAIVGTPSMENGAVGARGRRVASASIYN